MTGNSDTLKILLPISSFLPAQGGAEIGLHNIALQLLAKGHRPIVLAGFTHVRALKKNRLKIPYKVLSYPPRLLTWLSKRPAVGSKGVQWFHGHLQRRYGFDVWHATFGYPVGVSVIQFCRKKKIPHLVRCVGEDIQLMPEIGYGMRLNPVIDAQVRQWLPKAQRLVAITESVVAEYLALDVDEKRIARIPNGIDLARFKAHASANLIRERLGISQSTFVFLALGREHPKKNFNHLIQAAAQLRQQTKKPFAVIVAGRDVATLKDIVETHGVGDIVYLCEPTKSGCANTGDGALKLPSDEILDFYFTSDAFVMPSLIETFGIVTIEAMAAGLPVIAADSPGSRDIIRGGDDGLIYDGSLGALTRAMKDFLESKGMLLAFADKSRERAKDFDWSHIVDRYVNEYRELVQESSPKHERLKA